MARLMQGSPKIRQARDEFARKKVKLNIEKLLDLVKYEKKAK